MHATDRSVGMTNAVETGAHPGVVDKLSAARPVSAGVDRHRDGRRPAARARLIPGLNTALNHVAGRRHLTAHRDGLADHDVPGAGQGPLRPARHRHRRSQAPRQFPCSELGARPGADVRPGLAAAAGPARVPDRPDHRRAGPLHRDGHHLERPGLRRPRSRSGPRRAELDLPGHHVRRARLVLPVGAARLARPGADHHLHIAVADRQIRAHLPGHPAAGRLPVPTAR